MPAREKPARSTADRQLDGLGGLRPDPGLEREPPTGEEMRVGQVLIQGDVATRSGNDGGEGGTRHAAWAAPDRARPFPSEPPAVRRRSLAARPGCEIQIVQRGVWSGIEPEREPAHLHLCAIARPGVKAQGRHAGRYGAGGREQLPASASGMPTRGEEPLARVDGQLRDARRRRPHPRLELEGVADGEMGIVDVLVERHVARRCGDDCAESSTAGKCRTRPDGARAGPAQDPAVRRGRGSVGPRDQVGIAQLGSRGESWGATTRTD